MGLRRNMMLLFTISLTIGVRVAVAQMKPDVCNPEYTPSIKCYPPGLGDGRPPCCEAGYCKNGNYTNVDIICTSPNLCNYNHNPDCYYFDGMPLCCTSELACSFTSNLECDTNDYESQPPTTLAPATFPVATPAPNTPAPTACSDRRFYSDGGICTNKDMPPLGRSSYSSATQCCALTQATGLCLSEDICGDGGVTTTTLAPTTAAPTISPAPVTASPTLAPITPTLAPVTASPTIAPVPATLAPVTTAPTLAPITATLAPVTAAPTLAPITATLPPITTTLPPVTTTTTLPPVTTTTTLAPAPLTVSSAPTACSEQKFYLAAGVCTNEGMVPPGGTSYVSRDECCMATSTIFSECAVVDICDEEVLPTTLAPTTPPVTTSPPTVTGCVDKYHYDGSICTNIGLAPPGGMSYDTLEQCCAYEQGIGLCKVDICEDVVAPIPLVPPAPQPTPALITPSPSEEVVGSIAPTTTLTPTASPVTSAPTACSEQLFYSAGGICTNEGITPPGGVSYASKELCCAITQANTDCVYKDVCDCIDEKCVVDDDCLIFAECSGFDCCCSRFGYCGKGNQYCGNPDGSGGECVLDKDCLVYADCSAGNCCCSVHGYCGVSEEYCVDTPTYMPTTVNVLPLITVSPEPSSKPSFSSMPSGKPSISSMPSISALPTTTTGSPTQTITPTLFPTKQPVTPQPTNLPTYFPTAMGAMGKSGKGAKSSKAATTNCGKSSKAEFDSSECPDAFTTSSMFAANADAINSSSIITTINLMYAFLVTVVMGQFL